MLVCRRIHGQKKIFRRFPTRMVYLYYISYLRYTILVRNLQYLLKNSSSLAIILLFAQEYDGILKSTTR